VRGADFYDDYGHVPTALEVTLPLARTSVPVLQTRIRTVAEFDSDVPEEPLLFLPILA